MTPRLWLYVGGAAIVAAIIGAQSFRVASLKTDLAEEKLASAKQREAAVSAAVDFMRQQLETSNRRALETQGILNDEFTKRTRIEADLLSARAAGSSLRDAARSAASRCSAVASPANASSSPPAGNTGMVLADVLERLEARAINLAELADRRGLAGTTCERERDALTTPPAIHP